MNKLIYKWLGLLTLLSLIVASFTACRAPTKAPTTEPRPEDATPDPQIMSISLGGESIQGNGEIAWSNKQGIVLVSDDSGSSIPIAITNSSGVEVPGVGVASAANEEGLLILLVPPASSNYVPNYHIFEESLIEASALKLASLQPISTITLLEEDEAPLIENRQIPPSVLENLWNSAGWEKFVTRTNNYCESWSIYEEAKELGSLTISAGKAVLRRIGLKTLIKRVGNFLAISPLDVALELCLAATGDGPGLQGLTTVVNDDLDYSIAFVETIPDTYMIGRTVESNTDLPISGVQITTDIYETASLSDGMFIISGSSVYAIAIDYKHDDYEQKTTNVDTNDQNLINLGNISLSKLTSVVGDDLDGFKERLKLAIESADFSAMGELMCLPGEPEADFWYGIYMYEGMQETRAEALENMASWNFSTVSIDVSGLAEIIRQDLIQPPEFNGDILLAENWADGDENYLLEVRQDNGGYCWSGMLLYTNEKTPFGPVPPPQSDWDFGDLDIILRVAGWAMNNQRIDILESLISDPLFAYRCGTFCWGPEEAETQELLEDLYENVELKDASGFYYDPLEAVEPPILMAQRDSNLLAYRKGGVDGAYPVILGFSFLDGRYQITDILLPSIQ